MTVYEEHSCSSVGEGVSDPESPVVIWGDLRGLATPPSSSPSTTTMSSVFPSATRPSLLPGTLVFPTTVSTTITASPSGDVTKSPCMGEEKEREPVLHVTYADGGIVFGANSPATESEAKSVRQHDHCTAEVTASNNPFSADLSNFSLSEQTHNTINNNNNPFADDLGPLVMNQRCHTLSQSSAATGNHQGDLPPGSSQACRLRSLPAHVMVAYSAPCFGMGAINFFLTTFAAHFYTDTLNVDPGSVGLIEVVLMVLYAISQPIFGCLSDWATGPITAVCGRRKPFLIISSLAEAAAFYFLMCPPMVFEGRALQWWAVGCAILLGTSWGCFEVVYQGLGSQLTFDYDDRTKLQAFVVATITTGSTSCGILHGVLGSINGTGKLANRHRCWIIAIVNSSLFVLGTLVLFCGVPENLGFGDDKKVRIQSMRSKRNGRMCCWVEDFCDCVKSMFTNRPSNVLMATYSLALSAGAVTPAMLPYFCKHIAQTDLTMNWAPVFCTGAAVIGMPFWVLLGTPKVGFEKKWRFVMATTWLSICLLCTAILVHKGDSRLLVVLTTLVGLGMGGYFALPEAMKPDVVDYDEFRTGRRHEARYMGVYMCAANISVGLCLQLVFGVLKHLGYEGSRKKGDQPPEALLVIRIFYGGTVGILGVLMTGLLYFYPITRKKHAAILASTQARLNGHSVADPVYGGEALPSFETKPLRENSVECLPEPHSEEAEGSWYGQVSAIASRHGLNTTISKALF